MEYTPNSSVTPVVVYGSKVCNYGKFDSMAALLQNKGWNVIGGTNGDYYVMASCQPVGVLISEGEIKSSDGGFWGIGFRADGTAVMSRPEIKASITLAGRSYRVYGINKAITAEDFYLYTDDYAVTTKNSKPTVNVVLSYPEDYSLSIGSEAELTVEEIFESSGEAYLREGKLMLSLTQDSSSWRMDGVTALKPGDTVKLTVSGSEEWQDVEYAVGSMYRLISAGELQSGISDNQRAPRTAVGIKADGSVIFYTVDGRQSGYSAGLTIEEVSERLLELGCVEACLLDGGGSTNLHAQYVGDSAASQINKPSGGNERSVTNYIMLAAKADGSGNHVLTAVYPTDPIILAGASTVFSVKGADETSRPVAVNGNVVWSAASGTIDADGRYTAPRAAGTDTVSAAVNGTTDNAKIRVIETPDSISLSKSGSNSAISTLSLYTGESVQLTASAKYDTITVLSDAGAYKWSVSGTGSIDQNGVFTAGESSGSGKIIVSAGACSTEISVNVKVRNAAMDDFEDLVSGDPKLSQNAVKDYVRFGDKSLRFDYDCTAGVSSAAYSAKPDSFARYVSVWVYGDGSKNRVGFGLSDGSTVELGMVEFSGWGRMTARIPQNLNISSIYVDGSGSGTLYFDQLLVSTAAELDDAAPEISLSVSGSSVNAVIRDNCDAAVPRGRVGLYCDGKAMEFSYDESSGKLTATLQQSAGIHRVSLSARDQSGNLASASAMSGKYGAELPFEDVENHWAREYIEYMYTQEIVNGVDETHFSPDSSVSRAQCAVMICRWLGIDTSEYAGDTMTFADSAKIPDYAVDAVKAVYRLGIITGLDEPGGVYFAPNSALTREQAMTIMGRILKRGYRFADTGVYSDGGNVQSWAVGYVSELIGRGVISGFEDGTVRPGAPVTRAQLVKILTEVR